MLLNQTEDRSNIGWCTLYFRFPLGLSVMLLVFEHGTNGKVPNLRCSGDLPL
jgi:hypothetical protein